MSIQNVIIIGGGCAGLTAAIYSGRAGHNPLVFAGNLDEKGGLLTKTSFVENYPGFAEPIIGFDLMDAMEKQAIKCGATIIDSIIESVDFSSKPFKLIDDNKMEYFAKSVIIATGSKPNRLYLDNESTYWGAGISSCAVCDGALYKGKKIICVGGGDSAMEMANFLTKFSDVTIIHRNEHFAASKALMMKTLENKKITIITNTIITDVIGNNRLESIKIKNILTSEEKEMNVNGLFYAIGLIPTTKIFKGQIDIDNAGYIFTSKHPMYTTMTSQEGVFVAGDAHDKIYRQAVVAAGDGCRAALDVDNYLSHI